MIRKSMFFLLTLVWTAIMVMGCAHSNGTEKSAEGSGIVRGRVAVLTARVVAVELKKRIVTLKDEEGNIRDIKVGKEAVNLPQVKVGDVVTIKFYESIAVEMLKPGMAAAGSTTAIVRAKPGEMPGGMITQQNSVTATVKAIDRERGTVSLMGPDGKTVKVKVLEPANLDKVQLGDELMITYTEAQAISVERPR